MIGSIGQEFTVEEDIARRGLRDDVIAAGVDKAEVSADGRHFDPAGATQALERAAHGLDGQITGGVFQVDIGATVSTFISPRTSLTLTAPESSWIWSSASSGTLIWKSARTSSGDTSLAKRARHNVNAIARLDDVHLDARCWRDRRGP